MRRTCWTRLRTRHTARRAGTSPDSFLVILFGRREGSGTQSSGKPRGRRDQTYPPRSYRGQEENERKKCFPGVCPTPSSSRTFGITTVPRPSCRSRGSRRSIICSCSPWPPATPHRRPRHHGSPCPRRRPCLPSYASSLPHLRRPNRMGQVGRQRPCSCRPGSPIMGWCVCAWNRRYRRRRRLKLFAPSPPSLTTSFP